MKKGSPLFFYAETEVRDKTMHEEIKQYKKIFNIDLYDYFDFHFYCYQSYQEPDPEAFVIMDEVHDAFTATRWKTFVDWMDVTYKGAEMFLVKGLKNKYTMGLSATIPDLNVFTEELGDANNVGLKQADELTKLNYISPFITKRQMADIFGGIIYSYSQSKAIKEGILSPFETILIDHKLDNKKYNIKSGSEDNPFYQTEEKWYKGKLSWISKVQNNFMRKKIASQFAPFLYKLPSKKPIVEGIIKQHTNDKIVVFGARVDPIEEIVDHVVTGDKKTSKYVDEFNNGNISIIGSVVKLRQGITLEGVNVCILHSYFSKQYILEQIVGRVVRFSPNKVAKLYIIRTQGTMEANKWYPSILKKDDGTTYEINVIDIKSSNYYL